MSIFTSTDFHDRLPAMLVKELRQGLRAKTFISVFLGLQGVMLVILLTATASSSSADAGSVISGFIFTLFAIAVLVVQPLRGIGALSSEVKGGTLDMIVLTKLTARRIVHGKWFAIVSQSALLFATIIPYLIFRYFFGKMNLFGEVTLLMMIFLTSMALTAVTVGLSGSSSVILRALLPIIAIPVFSYVALMIIFMGGRIFGRSGIVELCAMGDMTSRLIVGGYVLAIAYIGWSLLSLGVSFIAPAAENHTTMRRLVTLAVAVAAGAIAVVPDIDEDFVPFMFALVAFPAFTIALTERTSLPSGVREPFTRNGSLGELAGAFFAPGWPSGVFFCLLVSAIFMGVSFADIIPHWTDGHQVAVAAIIGTLLLPALITVIARTAENARVSAYVLILIASMIFTMVMWSIIGALRNEELLWFLAWNPFTFLPILESKPQGHELAPMIAPTITACYFVILCILALIAMKKMRRQHTTTRGDEA